MIRYYLSSNNEMCYSTKIQFFSPTKHTLTSSLVEFSTTALWQILSVNMITAFVNPKSDTKSLSLPTIAGQGIFPATAFGRRPQE